MVLLDSVYDYGKIRSFLWKLEQVLLAYGLINLLGPSNPKLVIRTQTLGVTVLGSKNFFLLGFIKFCMKEALIFEIWMIFSKVMSVYSQKIEKKNYFLCYVSSL